MDDVTLPWIHDGEILLHIGVNKTGTSALQGAMALARPQLLEQGVCYPGSAPNHLNIIKSMLGRPRGWKGGGEAPRPELWQRIADEMATTPASKKMLSAEYICSLGRIVSRRIVDELGSDSVKVVVTLRPLEQLLPSQWQQGVKGRWTEHFGAFVDDACAWPNSTFTGSQRFWWRNDHASLIERWVGIVGPERVLAVVVDTSNRNMIFETFEDLLGISRGTVVASPASRTNRSLSFEEAELLRSFNEVTPDGMSYRFHQQVVRRLGIEGIVEGRRPGDLEHSLRLPRHAVERLREIGEGHVARIREMGIPVIGSLDALVPTGPVEDNPIVEPSVMPIDAAKIMLGGVVTASLEMVGELDARIAKLEKKNKRLEKKSRRRSPARTVQPSSSSLSAQLRRVKRGIRSRLKR
jgi:hypothetical protein